MPQMAAFEREAMADTVRRSRTFYKPVERCLRAACTPPRRHRAPQTLNVPNWPSDRHSISVIFADHPVD
jgi:hypothetical protein